jgi:hypothetical protein
MTDRRERVFLGALAAIGGLYVILFAWYFSATMIRRPYWDMFRYVMDYLEYPRHGGFLQYLWSQYATSEHRQIWMRLMTAIDVGVFRGVAYPFIVFATSCLLGVPLLMAREVARSGLPPQLAATAIWAVVLLVLTTANVVDCSIAIEGIYPQTVLFAVLSLVLFDGAGEGGRLAPWRRLGAMAAALGAGFACALGLIVWPILLWAAWRGGLGWRWMAAVALTGALFIGFYVHGLTFSGTTAAAMQGEGGFYAPSHLLKVDDAFLTFLGLPWTRGPGLGLLGRLLGAVLLVVGLGAILRRGFLAPRGGLPRLERIALGLIAFSLATAALGAVGRVGTEADGILPVRYSVFLVPLHLGLFCLALPWMKDRWANSSARRSMQAAALSLGALMLVQQIAGGEAGAAKAQIMNATIARFMAGERDETMTHIVYGDLTYAQDAVDEMRRRQIYRGLI